MQIYILRHGTTTWNSAHKIQGRADIPLDDIGTQMAVETGAYFKEKGIIFDRIFASPLQRALNTAKIVTGRTDIVTDDRLRELNFGRQEGERVEEMLESDMPFRYFRKAPEIYDRMAAEDETMESLTELCARGKSFMTEVIERLPKDTDRILISAHGALNKGILMHVRNESDISLFWGEGLSPNCGMDIWDYDFDTGTYTNLETNVIHYSDEVASKVTKLL
ncbi:MAG: histidine phosphatase family protein [Lachnospiraceae bacterium]|nr:histidine phosphatase family protein [Lachnospiraceae bacterium]